MEYSKLKLVIGFITYGKSTAKYLPYFLPPIVRTTDSHMIAHDFTEGARILCFDNSEESDNYNIKYIKENYPKIEIMQAGENLGFAKAYNRMIKKAKELGAEYFLALNPDMVLEPDAIKKMVEALDNDKNLGSVCPKILKWDFENNRKTNTIDSCGIILKPGLRFVNLAEGEKDKNFDEEILGPAGTAAMYRMSALEKVKTSPYNPPNPPFEGGRSEEYFDENMFMYKEDCDLAYRLFLAGFKSKCVYNAIMYHDRTVQAGGKGILAFFRNRKGRSKKVRQWSFLNQHIIFIKFWKLQNLNNKLAVVWHVLKMFIFVLLFEQYLLQEYFNLWKIRKDISRHK